MPNLSKTFQCLWNLSKGNLHRIYLYENAFDFLVNNFNQKLFQDQVNGIIYSGTPCILLLPCSRVISKRTYVEFMHVASFLRVRVGGGGSLIPEILKSMGWGGGLNGCVLQFQCWFLHFYFNSFNIIHTPPPKKKGGGGGNIMTYLFFI